jgi:cell division FtsZ-interacting protein ZapD
MLCSFLILIFFGQSVVGSISSRITLPLGCCFKLGPLHLMLAWQHKRKLVEISLLKTLISRCRLNMILDLLSVLRIYCASAEKAIKWSFLPPLFYLDFDVIK